MLEIDTKLILNLLYLAESMNPFNRVIILKVNLQKRRSARPLCCLALPWITPSQTKANRISFLIPPRNKHKLEKRSAKNTHNDIRLVCDIYS